MIAFELEYRRSAAALGPAHRLGATGVTVPVDAVVRSGGQPYGDTASIRVGMGEVAPNRRGYNLVALEPAGRDPGPRRLRHLRGSDGERRAGERGCEALPAGTIVLGAVKDEASERARRRRGRGPRHPRESTGTFGAATASPTPSSA